MPFLYRPTNIAIGSILVMVLVLSRTAIALTAGCPPYPVVCDAENQYAYSSQFMVLPKCDGGCSLPEFSQTPSIGIACEGDHIVLGSGTSLPNCSPAGTDACTYLSVAVSKPGGMLTGGRRLIPIEYCEEQVYAKELLTRLIFADGDTVNIVVQNVTNTCLIDGRLVPRSFSLRATGKTVGINSEFSLEWADGNIVSFTEHRTYTTGQQNQVVIAVSNISYSDGLPADYDVIVSGDIDCPVDSEPSSWGRIKAERR